MGRHQKNQSGFSLIEGLLVALVLVVVGFGGYYIWHAQQTNNKPESSSAQPDTSEPAVRLEKLYQNYLSDASSYRGDSGLARFKASGYVAQDYVTENNTGEPLVCGQEAYPNKISVELVSKTGDKAVLSGTKLYDDGGTASQSITAEMSLNSSSEWQLQKTICSQLPSQSY